MDVAHLVQRHEHLQAGLYLAGSVAVSILALYAGLWLVRWVLA
jgi:fluoride ion exporter CrcB/FEX